MSKKIHKTKEGKQILKSNLEKILKDLKNETGWFSKEEDEYWQKFRNQRIILKEEIKKMKKREKRK